MAPLILRVRALQPHFKRDTQYHVTTYSGSHRLLLYSEFRSKKALSETKSWLLSKGFNIGDDYLKAKPLKIWKVLPLKREQNNKFD